jgi:hypothetical protein
VKGWSLNERDGGTVVKSDVAFVDVGVCRLNKRRLDVVSASLYYLLYVPVPSSY